MGAVLARLIGTWQAPHATAAMAGKVLTAKQRLSVMIHIHPAAATEIATRSVGGSGAVTAIPVSQGTIASVLSPVKTASWMNGHHGEAAIRQARSAWGSTANKLESVLLPRQLLGVGHLAAIYEKQNCVDADSMSGFYNRFRTGAAADVIFNLDGGVVRAFPVAAGKIACPISESEGLTLISEGFDVPSMIDVITGPFQPTCDGTSENLPIHDQRARCVWFKPVRPERIRKVSSERREERQRMHLPRGVRGWRLREGCMP